MKAVPCICLDLELDESGIVSLGTFLPYSSIGYPRRTWWKFWERKRTREEYLADEHEKYMAEGRCHIWKGQEFHFSNTPGTHFRRLS